MLLLNNILEENIVTLTLHLFNSYSNNMFFLFICFYKTYNYPIKYNLIDLDIQQCVKQLKVPPPTAKLKCYMQMLT